MYFLYPESHKAALWLGVLFIAAQFVQNSIFAFKNTVIGICALLVIGAIWQWKFLPAMAMPEAEAHFWLVPGNDPIPTNNPCERWIGSAVPTGATFLYAGNFVYWIGQGEVIKDHALISIRRKPLLRFSRDSDGRIAISGDVRDQQGDVVAHIDHNEVRLICGKYSWAERSGGDRSTVAVKGPKGDELFYLRFTNPSTIRLRGIFPISYSLPRAPPVIVTDSAIQNGGLNMTGTICTHSSNPHTGTINFGD